MHILKFFIKTIIVLLIVFVIGGFLIPDDWIVMRSVIINAHPEKIYPFVSDFKEWEKWSPWNAAKDPTLKYTYEGPDTGVGAKQCWTSKKMGNGCMQFTSANPQTGVAYDLSMNMGRMQSILHGTIDFTFKDEKTIVTWTDRGNSGKSFIKRWMSLMIKPMLGKEMNKGLDGLKAIVEEK